MHGAGGFLRPVDAEHGYHVGPGCAAIRNGEFKTPPEFDYVSKLLT